MTDPGQPAERTGVARPLILALLGIAILAAAGAFVLRLQQPAPAPPVAAIPTPPSAAPPSTAPPSTAPPSTAPHDAPGFDIVRISPQGDAVMAGHAAPGAEVRVSDAGKEVGRATADNAGNWVIVPTAPLPSGARELTLSERLADGSTVNGTGSVVMVVPGATAPAPALALLDQPGAPPRVLQAPTGGQNARLAFAAVDYDDRGELRFAGTAPPGAPVRVYIDNRMAGDATADAQGRWTLSPSASVAPGAHHLRLDQIDRRGAVVARVEVPFQREQLTADALGGNRIVVQPGESLWRLARQTYGSGLRYTVIYQANQTQLRSPDKIYPGQTLTMPQDAAQQSR